MELKVHTDLAAENQGIVDFPGSARVDDVLNIWLKKDRVSNEIEAIGRFQNSFVVLRRHGGIKQLLSLLRIAQVTAELAENNSNAGQVPWTRLKNPTRYDASREKIRHLTDGLIR